MHMQQNHNEEDGMNGEKNDFETIEQNYTYAALNELGTFHVLN